MQLTRFYQIIPGALVWSAFILPIILSFFAPEAVVIFILLFDLYWVYKALIMGIHLLSGYKKMHQSLAIDWRKKIDRLRHKSSSSDLNPLKIYHAVILPTYKEGLAVLAPSIQSIVGSDFPTKKIIFVLATEARERQRARKIAAQLIRRYGKKFKMFLTTEHVDSAGEVKGKGANATWAARKLSRWIEQKKIDPINVIVTTADADTRFHKKFFDCLAYKYAVCPERLRRSFQPIPIYSNNIWHATVFARILAFGSSFWQMIESTRPWRLINFSTHSMSLKTLQAMDYWDKSVVNEDSRQFWRAYYKFKGDHQVIPLFFPIHMDAVIAENIWLTIKNQYRQRLRWAYGVEHAPYIFSQTFSRNGINFRDKLVKMLRFIENNFSWATASVFIAVLGWLPYLLNPDFGSTVLAFNIRHYSSYLLSLAWLGLLVSAVISMKLLPPRPPGFHRIKGVAMFSQWIFIPIVAILFSSFPAIDAQTRLMLGRYLGFVVTEKEQTKT